MIRLFLLLILAANLFAQKELDGVLYPGDYVFDEDIIIPKGKQLVIDAGANIFIKGYRSIKVHGSLISNGNQKYPVTISSINEQDSSKTTTVNDWNRIIVFNGGRVQLTNTIIKHSENVLFIKDEGKYSFNNVNLIETNKKSFKFGQDQYVLKENTLSLVNQEPVVIEPTVQRTPSLPKNNQEETTQESESSNLKYYLLGGGIIMTGIIIWYLLNGDESEAKNNQITVPTN